MEEEIKRALASAALEARKQAYCPYSHFAVGTALLTADGDIVTGCNVECASYGGTNCAERTAIFRAIAAGTRNFSALAIAGGVEGVEPEAFCPPCGICRQVLAEFCGEDFPILLVKSERERQEYTLGQLLPAAFGPEVMG